MSSEQSSNPIQIQAHNNDLVALVAWNYEKKIPGCLGFSLVALNQATGERQVLKTYLPFKGSVETRRDQWKGEPSTVLPIQRNHWLHVWTGKQDVTVVYELTPMVGTPGDLKPLEAMRVTSNPVTFTTKVDDTFSCAFTRGILSTQWLAHTLPTDADGLPDWQVLVKALNTPGDPLRKRLVGNVPEMLMEPVNTARAEGGHVYQALYELADPELVEFLCRPENLPVFSLILGNTGADDETNQEARKRLHELNADIQDRMLGGWGIAHNKSQVRTGADGKAKVVTTGSTNWTFTGLGCQSNMAVAIRNGETAEQFLDYWQRLKADDAEQTSEFRRVNGQGCKVTRLADGTEIEVWFSPNTPEKEKDKNSPMPPDLARVKQLLDETEEVVAGEVFYPGNPSVIHWMADLWNTKPNLYMFMTVSSVQAMYGVKTKRRRGRPPLFTIASGRERMTREQELASFVKELLKLPEAHAITHGKILVRDPFGKNPVVIFGSHNLGYKASYANDENLVIVRGNRRLAQYVFVNMFDLFQHFLPRSAGNFRRRPKEGTPEASKVYGVLETTDSWQDAELTGYRAKQSRLLATGVWDGSGMEDPDWLKPVLVVPFPKRTPKSPSGGGTTTGATQSDKPAADASTPAPGGAVVKAQAPAAADTDSPAPATVENVPAAPVLPAVENNETATANSAQCSTIGASILASANCNCSSEAGK